MPKANAKEKRLAEERQAVTGKPYTACLAEIRAEYEAQKTTQEAKPKTDT